MIEAQLYQKESMDLVGGDRQVVRYTPQENTFHLADAERIIKGNIDDLKEYISKEKERVYQMASHYEYVRDHSIEIDNIKREVSRREIELQAYEHCLRIVRGESKI